eukprot:329880_1
MQCAAATAVITATSLAGEISPCVALTVFIVFLRLISVMISMVRVHFFFFRFNVQSKSMALSALHDNVYIIGTIMCVSLLCILLSLVLHFRQHFKCQSCCPSTSGKMVVSSRSSSLRPRSSSLAQMAINVKESRLQCLCGTHDGDDFDFFPMAFFLYLILIIFICLLLSARFVMMYMNDAWHESVVRIIYPSIDDLTTISFESNDNEQLLMMFIDYAVIYLTMVMSLMESLFNFYRFYTTLMTTKKLILVTTQDVIKHYLIYSLIFAVLYVVVIHIYFWLFPILILVHCVFGIYCIAGFASTLITSYTNFVGLGASVNEANQQVLRSVYFMRKISFKCTVLQSVYLSLFMLIYHINFNLIIIYLPILWSLTSFIFALNFVRNREAVQHRWHALTCAKKKGKTLQMPLEHVKTVSADPSPVINTKPPAIETETMKHVSFNSPENNAAPATKHVSFGTTNTNRKDSNTVSEQNQQMALDHKPRALSAGSDGGISIRIIKPFAPLPIDVPVMPVEPQRSVTNRSNRAQSSPHSDQNSPYTPSSASMKHRPDKHHLTFKDMANDTMRSYQGQQRPGMGRHLSGMSGHSLELTQQMSGFEMSMFTETDVGGTKLEEYNRHLAGEAMHQDVLMTTPQMRSKAPSNRELPQLDIDGSNPTVKHLGDRIIKSSSHHEHKLDAVQLTLQLGLLKKFGFNVNRIEKSIK